MKRTDSKNRVLHKGESERKDEGRYIYGWTDLNGKRRYVYAKTLAELRLKEKEIERDLEDGIHTSDITIGELYAMWIQGKRSLKPSSYENYVFNYNQYIQAELGHKKVRDMKKSHIRAFYNGLVDSGRLQLVSMRKLEIILKGIFDLAVDDDYIRKNPTRGVLAEIKKANHYETPKRSALTLEQQRAFLGFMEDKPKYYRWELIFTIFIGTGMRMGELLGLRWEDVDLEKEKISINHTLCYRSGVEDGKSTAKHMYISTPKSKSGTRIIYMVPKVKEAFEKERKRQQQIGLCCETELDGYKDFIFVSESNSLMFPDTVNRKIKQIIASYNKEEAQKASEEGREPKLLPDFTCHNLRHTFCTRMCENDLNVKAIQEIMGHANSSITLDVYAEAQESLKKDSMKKLSESMNLF